MPSEDDVTKNMAEGMTSAAIHYGEEKLKILLSKIRAGKLGFIKKSETIEIVKEQRKSGEYALIKEAIRDKNLRLMVQMGLTLRRLQRKGEREQILNLRDKIRKKHGTEALHIAQFVQNGLMTPLILSISEYSDEIELQESVEEFLKDIEVLTLWIQARDSSEDIARIANARLDAHAPRIFLVFSKESAVCIGKEVAKLMKERNDYLINTMSRNKGLIILFTRCDKEDPDTTLFDHIDS